MSRNELIVAPSIFAADLGCLAAEAQRLEKAGADAIHVDIMDGHFVPNLSLGPRVLAALNRATTLFLDVHIMVYNPFDLVETLVRSGADRITFHFEATEDVEDILRYIRRHNVQAGLALCPETAMDFAFRFLDECDLVLLMTVNPGFSGQAFIPEVLDKMRALRKECDARGLKDFPIEVDGGINAQTGRQCVEAGANVLVAGTYVFEGDPTMAEAIQKLKQCKG